MNRNILYLIIGALVVAQDRQKTTGIQINVGNGGISTEKK